jgi:hypothetical protein
MKKGGLTMHKVFLALLFFFQACKDTSTQPTDEGRIVLGVSIDNVEIGDDAPTVSQKLGPPNFVSQDDFKGFIYSYTEGKYSLMRVSLSEDMSLGLGVIVVLVEPPYTGKTNSGFGIGSSREKALDILGLPDTSYVSGSTTDDSYFYQRNSFHISYRGGKAYSIAMGVPRIFR